MDFDLAPWLERDPTGEPAGKMREWADAALAQLGCRVTWERLPVRRIMRMVDQGAIDIVLGASWTGTNDRLAFPMNAYGALNEQLLLIKVSQSLFVLSTRRHEITGEGRHLRGNSLRVGVVAAMTQVAMTEGRGWILELAPTFEVNLQKLHRGRIDLALMPSDFFNLKSTNSADRLVELSPPVYENLIYAPVSRQLMERDPAFVHAFWLNICRRSRTASPALPKCEL